MHHRGYQTRRGPSYGSSERSPPVYSPKRKSFMGHHLSHSGSLCAKWIQCRSTIRPNHNAKTGRLSELSNETTTRRAHTVIPRRGSAYKPKGYSSHPHEPLSIFLIFCRDNRYRCPLLNESRTTTTVRTTSNIGACPDVPPTRAVTNKANCLLTMSHVWSMKSSTFVQQDICRPRTVPGPPHTGGIHLTCRSAKIPCAGTVGSPDTLPVRTTVVQYPMTAIQSQQRVEYKDYSSIAHT